MLDQELLARLDQWHEENQHKRIVQEIQGLPEEVREEYEVQGRLGRAWNNLGKYRQALEARDEKRLCALLKEGRERKASAGGN